MERGLFVIDLLGLDTEGRQVISLECGHLRVMVKGRPDLRLWDLAACPKGCQVDARGNLSPGYSNKKGGD